MLDFIIIVSTVIALILAARNNWWTWPMNILSASILMYFFFCDGMYISFLNNLYTVIISFISCFTWKRKNDENANEIKKLDSGNLLKYIIYYCGLILIFWCANHAISTYPILDAIGVASFVLGTYGLSKHYVESWILYLIGDISYIIVGFIGGSIVYSILYCLMIGVDYYGLKMYKEKCIYFQY